MKWLGKLYLHLGLASNCSVREREILRMYAQGMSYADIASVRGNKPMTVRNSVYEIQRKLKVKTKQELGVWTVRSGLLDEEEVA